MIDSKLLEGLVYTNPLGLLVLRDKKDIELANSYLPYSTGFEIECDQNKEAYNVEDFRAIPNIVEVLSDSHEQRYRIPNGINGLICLWHISNECKRSLLLNMGSGIHYHVDCRDAWTAEFGEELKRQESVILEELSTWKNKGTYNNRGISYGYILGGTFHSTRSWVRMSYYNTLEFRIGEMTFEYQDWVKCIIECNVIVKKVKDAIGIVPLQPAFKDVDTKAIMKYSNTILYAKARKSREDALREKLANLTTPSTTTQVGPDFETMRELIRNRTQNL